MSQELKQDKLPQKDRKDTISEFIFLSILFFAILFLPFLFDVDLLGIGLKMTVIVYIAGILVVILLCGRNCIFTEKAIVYRIFGYTYQKVLWEDIIQVGILSVWVRRHGYADFIVLTPKGCPKFESGRDDPTKYYVEYSHPSKLHTLPTQESNKKILRETVRLIEKYYGPLDYGYDKLF